MKKFIYSVISLGVLAAMATSCDLFKLDNYEQPNAQITGKFTDPEGNNIQFDNNCSVKVIEDVSDRWNLSQDPSPMSWRVKFDGTYTNNLIFAGKYAVDLSSLPVFVNGYKDTIIVRKGGNIVNFDNKVPFCYINLTPESFSWNEATGKITAKVVVEPGMANKANNIIAVGLYSSYSNFVSQTIYLTKAEIKEDLKAGEEITLEIATIGQDQFKYERKHYFRVAAVCVGNNQNPNKLYNYSKTFVMDTDHQFSEYDWATAAEN